MSNFGILTVAVLVGLATGCLLATQPSVNGQLGRSVAHPMQASMISFASGAAIVFVICLAMGRFPPEFVRPAGQLPWWIWFGGAIGVVMVTTSLIFVPRVGSLPWFAAVMTGQTVGAVILDHYGWLGNPRAAASPMRLLGTALLIAGVLVIVAAQRQVDTTSGDPPPAEPTASDQATDR
ncbi:DMT family transporter [Crateriforma conspicua]|uniref:DMT family transporter n=1 Tax=Crateriforma conspicua TaxID=2527996 RepID=UPI0018C8A877|nr:DMT family transporter [Crateriforma conspicua]